MKIERRHDKFCRKSFSISDENIVSVLNATLAKGEDIKSYETFVNQSIREVEQIKGFNGINRTYFVAQEEQDYNQFIVWFELVIEYEYLEPIQDYEHRLNLIATKGDRMVEKAAKKKAAKKIKIEKAIEELNKQLAELNAP